MAKQTSGGTKGAGKFKKALDKQNRAETGRTPAVKHQRDRHEAEAAQHGLPMLERGSKGRPKQG